MTVRPTFLFIGADRCGSKSLHNMFRQHPDCYVPPIADPYFFDKNYDRGLDWYFKLFADSPASALGSGNCSRIVPLGCLCRLRLSVVGVCRFVNPLLKRWNTV